MNLQKLIDQLTEREYLELLQVFEEKNAEKSSAYFALLRDDPDHAEERFLRLFEISASAFYVLKSRLNQKVEQVYLQRLDKARVQGSIRALRAEDMVFNQGRDETIAALNQLEKELEHLDMPRELVQVYKQLQRLYAYEEKFDLYLELQRKAQANALAQERAEELFVQFFRSYENYYLGRGESDYYRAVGALVQLVELAEATESHRIRMYSDVVAVYGQLNMELPDNLSFDLQKAEELMTGLEKITAEFEGDSQYDNIKPILISLRYNQLVRDERYAEARAMESSLEYYADLLIEGYNLLVPGGHFLRSKMELYTAEGRLDELENSARELYADVEGDPYWLSSYYDLKMFLAQVYFSSGDFSTASRTLFFLGNEVYLKNKPHAWLQMRIFQALVYAVKGDYDLAQQAILSMQRQLRKPELANFAHTRKLLRILSIYLGANISKKEEKLEAKIAAWNEENHGQYAILGGLDLRAVLLGELAIAA